MESIQVLDKTFQLYMPEDEIQSIVRRVAADISRDYAGKKPILCPILTGSFMFAADLLRELDIDSNVSFVRYSSYVGMASTGQVKELLGFPKDCRGRDVIIIEDIIDSGVSMEYMLEQLKVQKPSSIAICAFLFRIGIGGAQIVASLVVRKVLKSVLHYMFTWNVTTEYKELQDGE